MLRARSLLPLVPFLVAAAATRVLAQGVTHTCTDPIQIVETQIAAYNRHDLDAFVATYSPDVELHLLPTDTPAQGQAALRQAYEFLRHEPPEFGVDITQRITAGCFVIDHERERATGTQPAHDVGVAIYQVEGRLIRRVWFIYQ
jgi:hypothetical protein